MLWRAYLREFLDLRWMIGEKHGFLQIHPSIYLHCEEIAEIYKRSGQFPPILLCDVVLRHGRDINYVLELMEERIIESLTCQNGETVDKEAIRMALASAVDIVVYMRSTEPLLLLPRYTFCLRAQRQEPAVVWHRLSAQISALIAAVDIMNGVFIYSKHISESEFARLEKNQIYQSMHFEKTDFQRTHQYAFVDFLRQGDVIKAAYTLRITKNTEEEGYRLIPFVFMPNLYEDETDKIKKAIQAKLNDYGNKKGKCTKDIEEALRLSVKRGSDRDSNQTPSAINAERRYENELITMIFSNAILTEFCRKCGIELSNVYASNNQYARQDIEREIKKLSRNYMTSDRNMQETEKLLHEMLLDPFISCKNELNEMITSSFRPDEMLCRIRTDASSRGQEELLRMVEEYWYQQGLDEECGAIEKNRKNRIMMNMYNYRSKSAKTSEEVLKKLCQDLNVEDTKTVLRFLVQMMDMGVFNVAPAPMNRNIDIVGYTQYARAGEQSLALMPIRLNKYMPLIIKASQYCKKNQLRLKDHLIAYRVAMNQVELTDETIEEIASFVEGLNKVEQRPEDWGGEYYYLVPEYEMEDGNYHRVIEYVNKKEEYVESYTDYIMRREIKGRRLQSNMLENIRLR